MKKRSTCGLDNILAALQQISPYNKYLYYNIYIINKVIYIIILKYLSTFFNGLCKPDLGHVFKCSINSSNSSTPVFGHSINFSPFQGSMIYFVVLLLFHSP